MTEFKKHKVVPSEQDIQRYYDEHKDLFVQDPGEVRLSHIAIKLPPNPTDAQKADGKRKSSSCTTRRSRPRTSRRSRRKNSEDASTAPKGGDLGYFTKGQLPPVVDQARVRDASRAGIAGAANRISDSVS